MLNSIKQWFERRTPTSTLSAPTQWLREAFGASETYSGQSVTPDNALRSTAVLGCIRVLSEGVAIMPGHVYKRTGKVRDRAPQHPTYRMIHRRPNPRQTIFEYLQLTMVHRCLHGNSYSEIIRDKSGNAIELWPIHPSIVVMKSDHYEVYANGKRTTIPWADMLHLKGLSTDGLLGLSPIQAARQSIGLGLAAEKFGATYFSNGSQVGGVLTLPTDPGAAKVREIHDSWDQGHTGPDQAHRIAVLTGGASFESFKINNSEAQWLDSRRFSVEDVCRIFRVPGHLVADMSRSNFSNIDAMDRAFIQHSLMPWLVSQEQAFTARLLSEADQDAEYYIEHNVGAALRGDPESQMRSFQSGIYSGIYSPNDARELLNLNPREGGDVYLQPVNLAPSPFVPAQNQQPQEVIQ